MKFHSILCSLMIFSFGYSLANENHGQEKGLFTIQFSWNSQSFSSKNSVEIQYKKEGLLKKSKSTGGGIITSPKNSILNLELSPGVYHFEALKMVGPDFGYGKYLKIPFDQTFEIKAGQVTNGGLFFIGKENKESLSIYFLTLDNDKDIERFVSIHHREYAPSPEDFIRPWQYTDDQILGSIIEAYAATLIPAEENRKRPKVNYLYTTLGIVMKMKKDETGKVLEHELIKTPSYQEIVEMAFKDGKMICRLGNGDYWYGESDAPEYLPLPDQIRKYGKLYYLGPSKFIFIENDYGIHFTNSGFDWKSQNEFRIERKYGLLKDQNYSIPNIYFGGDHMYIYSTTGGKYKRLLSSTYDDIAFQEVNLGREVKQVPMITETKSQLILGPDLKIFANAKRPAFLYVQDRGSTNWNVIDLPRGDCNRFGVDSENDTIYYVTCGGEVRYTSTNAGATWELRNSAK